MGDQLSDDYRALRDMSAAERAASLWALHHHMWWTQNRHWTQDAAIQAGTLASLTDIRFGYREPSPIRWGELLRSEMARRLVEVADWCREVGPKDHQPLQEACLRAVEDLNRPRPRAGRDR